MAAYSHRSYRQPEAPHAALVAVVGGLAFTSSYDAALVAEFKRRVPADGRRWDPVSKVWLVAPQYGQMCADLAARFLGVGVAVPTTSVTATTETRLLKIEYLGRTKDRGNGESSAYGYCGGSWSVIFPEDVLREWFEAIPQKPGEKPTLYAVLGIRQSTDETDLRSAYRRLARQWHPDVCHEVDAVEQFKAIQGAYEVLGDPLKRRKYDAGLAFAASAVAAPQPLDRSHEFSYTMDGGYRPVLRCGWILCEGVEALGRFAVERILQFEDIVNDRGQVMVVSWPAGADAFEVDWR